MSEFKPLFDKEDPRDDPNRDITKPVLPVKKLSNSYSLQEVLQEERITDTSIRFKDYYKSRSLPLTEPCCCDGLLWLKPTIGGKVFHHSHPDSNITIACSCYAAEQAGKSHDYLWANSGLSRADNIPKISDFKPDLSEDAGYAKSTIISCMEDKNEPSVLPKAR